MKAVIIASSNFNNKNLFNEKINLNNYDEIIVKSKSKIADWVKEFGYTPTEFAKYADLQIPTGAEIIAFWDGESLNVKNIVDAHPETTVISFENTTTKSFYDEINQIHNEDWKNAVLDLTKKLPNYFWVTAASSSGKYHPKCDLGTGGLVRHSVLVCEFGVDFLKADFMVPYTEELEDMVRIACLFHDGIKQGFDSHGYTTFEHPLLAAQFLRDNLKGVIPDDKLEIIAKAVESHMGKWTTNTRQPDVILRAPETSFEKLIHAADYAASRKYVGGLECWQ